MSQSYTLFVDSITSGTAIIPVGAKNWAIAVDSGVAYVNGKLIPNGISIEGDNHVPLASEVTVGCTGGLVVVYWNQ